jgi:multicomponent Na+:H+ antiporter subunit B
MNRPLDDIILRTLCGPIVVALQLFAVYVLMHGHYSPGGGFQAGVLLAASVIVPRLAHGNRARAAGYLDFSPAQALALAAAGVMIYAIIGIVPILYKAAMLDYGALPFPKSVKSAERHSLGILGIEVGVTLGVAGAALSIYHSLYADDPAPTTTPREAAE